MTREEAIRSFDENGVGAKGTLFGLPFTPENAQVVIIPVPWEVTVSYGGGTAQGPEAILDASPQLDLQLNYVPDAWKLGISMLPIPEELRQLSHNLRQKASTYIAQLEEGFSKEEVNGDAIVDQVLAGSQQMIGWVEEQATQILLAGKIPAVLGGDHSSPLGLLSALAKHNPEFAILQIDAHADLRIGYEGFKYSHASIMYNALQLTQVKKLIQVGIRDICEQEIHVAETEGERVCIAYDSNLKQDLYEGKTWKSICLNIVNKLPKKVYISFDIDGLDPKLCPATGTPVPGGLQFTEAIYLLKLIHESGKEIIGFDLCEVAPGHDQWNGNVGARVLYNLAAITGMSNGLL